MTDDDVKLPEPDVLHEVNDAPCPLCGTMLRVNPPIKLGYTAATVRRLIAEAMGREREACAVLCDAYATQAMFDGDPGADHEGAAQHLADAIRNRSKA
mgnify:CR=1 FL=1